MFCIYNEDCISGMKRLVADQSVDVIVTSPPYNIGMAYSIYRDTLPEDAYLQFLDEVFIELKRAMKTDASLFFNIGARPRNQNLQFKVINLALNHFNLQNTIHWIKSIHVGGKTSGHVKPVNSKKYLTQQHEFVLHLVKQEIQIDKLAIGVPYTDKSNLSRWKSCDKDIRDRGNVWFLPYATTNGSKDHPAGFPVELPLQCIRLHGEDKVQTILDPFLGSGTTAQASQALNKSFIGFELDENYYQRCVEKLRLKV